MTDVKTAAVTSIEEIKAQVLKVLENRERKDEGGILLMKTSDDMYCPLFLEAFRELRDRFFEINCIPVIEVSTPVTQSKLIAALAFLALQEALNQLACLSTSRDEWKDILFNNAALVIRNSSPDLVMDIITKEFNDQIVDFLVKS